MCLGCHSIPGYQASFPEVHHVPMISGQGAKYIAAALTAYKNGDRKHPTMRAIAGSLSEQDINDVAAFYAGQAKQGADGELRRNARTKQDFDDRGSAIPKVGRVRTARIDEGFRRGVGHRGQVDDSTALLDRVKTTG